MFAMIFRAVKLAFNGHAYKLAGSSLKSMIGHPQGACGAGGHGTAKRIFALVA